MYTASTWVRSSEFNNLHFLSFLILACILLFTYSDFLNGFILLTSYIFISKRYDQLLYLFINQPLKPRIFVFYEGTV